MSRASSGITTESTKAGAYSTIGPRRWTLTCEPWPSASRAWGRIAPSTHGSRSPSRAAFSSTCSALPALYGFARRRFGCRVALWSMAVLAILPVHAIYAGFVLRESLVALMSILAVWTLTEVWHADSSRRSAWVWAVAAGICGGLAVLSRTTGLAILAASGLFALVTHGRRRFGPLLLWGVTVIVVIVPWAWATLQEYGTPFYSYTGLF